MLELITDLIGLKFLMMLWKWIFRCLQYINKKSAAKYFSYFSIKQNTKDKQNFVKKILMDYEYIGGLDVTNVLLVKESCLSCLSNIFLLEKLDGSKNFWKIPIRMPY